MRVTLLVDDTFSAGSIQPLKKKYLKEILCEDLLFGLPAFGKSVCQDEVKRLQTFRCLTGLALLLHVLCAIFSDRFC